MPETPEAKAKTRLEKPNYTQIPNSWLDNAVPQIASAAELKVTLALFRQTFGWYGKQQSQIQLTCTQIAKLAGLKKTGAFEGITAALKRGLVYRVQTGPQSFAYGLQIGDEEMPLDVKEPFIPKNNTSNLTEEPSVRANGTVRQGERLGGESLYMKEREINGDTRSQTGQTRKKPSSPKGRLPHAEVITSIRLPADFSITPEMRAWGERELPPETAARLDELRVCFVLKYRDERPNERRDGLAAWVARWKSYMLSCASNAKEHAGRRGAGGGAAVVEDYSRSYEELVRIGSLPPELPTPPRSTAPRPAPVASGGDKCSF